MGPVAQQAGRLGFHVLGVEEGDGPSACARLLSQDFEIHDGIGPALVRHTTLPRDVVGEIIGPGAERARIDGWGTAVAISASAADVARLTDARTSATRDARAASSSCSPV